MGQKCGIVFLLFSVQIFPLSIFLFNQTARGPLDHDAEALADVTHLGCGRGKDEETKGETVML